MLMQDNSSGFIENIAIPPSPIPEQSAAELSQHPDAQVWQAFKAGNEKAFASIYNLYVHALYNYGYRIAPDQELVEDCIQDLFINLWHNRKSLGDTTSVKFYLYKSLKRSIIKKIVSQRKHVTHVVSSEEYCFDMTLSPEFEMIAEQISQQQKDSLLAALNNLSQRQKEAIILKFYHDLSYQEVASLMCMSVKASYNLIYRAIHVLKTHIDKIFLLLFITQF